jgi:hypothetical protein
MEEITLIGDKLLNFDPRRFLLVHWLISLFLKVHSSFFSKLLKDYSRAAEKKYKWQSSISSKVLLHFGHFGQKTN